MLSKIYTAFHISNWSLTSRALYFIALAVNTIVKWDMALIYSLLEFELALLRFNDALELKESALFRSLILSQILFKSYLIWFIYARYALNVLSINLIPSALHATKYRALDFTFFSLV